jgi:hypothetical protein
MRDSSERVVYWHRELPPVEAEIASEHTIEAVSGRVPSTIAHRDDLWGVCYEDLMTQARIRLEQEVARLEGHYAHVFDEAIDIRRDEAKGETWLRGRFSYVLYRRPSTAEDRTRRGAPAASVADRECA